MAVDKSRTVVVLGATGLQGGEVARHLLQQGWRVRAVTRNPQGERAQALAALGIEVAQGDMEAPASLAPLFAGSYGVFSVQNPFLGGVEAEVRQGRNVADAAQAAGVAHLVYGSAGTGEAGTGIPSWESKLAVEAYMKALGLPLTIVRPMAFMELMTEKKFFPQASTWHVMPKLMGGDRPVGWLSAGDLGYIVARIFEEPERYLGRELQLVSDVRSINEARTIYRAVMGKNPPRLPLPAWLFTRFGFVGQDLSTMWRWLRTATLDMDTGPTRAIHPVVLTVRDWLAQQKEAMAAPARGNAVQRRRVAG